MYIKTTFEAGHTLKALNTTAKEPKVNKKYSKLMVS
jgi:hypothetical protein